MKQKLITLFATLLCSISMFADGALSGKFTINDSGNQVSFSQGNLQYRQSDNTYRFAPTQYAIQGDENQTALETIDAGNNTSVYIDLFGWGTGTAPYFHGTSGDSYPKFYEWGNEPITNGGNTAIPWRTLTGDEWRYLFYYRTNAEERFAFGKVNGVNGLIILPDEWETPSGLTFKPSTTRGLEWSSDAGAYINTYENNFDHNTYKGTDWDSMQEAGAVFLPAAGSREGTKVSSSGREGYYWSSSYDAYETGTAYCISFDKGNFQYKTADNRSKGMSVRLVQEVPKLEVYTEFVDETGTLTYYYDMKRLERTGVTEKYEPVSSPNAKRFEGYATKVKKAVIDPSMKKASLESMSYMFYGGLVSQSLSNMTTIEGLENLKTSKVTDMIFMFSNCKALTSLNLTSFNTKNVTNMRSMFGYCSALTSLDLTSFNTAKVTDMGFMFLGCSALTSLDVSSFNTANVTNMNEMFTHCKSLTSLDVSTFNTAKVTDMGFMFYNCKALTSLDLTSFNTENVSTMESMFFGCSSLTSLDLSKLNTEKVKRMNKMFADCSALTSVDVSSFNTAKVTNMESMFYDCKALTSLDLTSFNTNNVELMTAMFGGCSALTSIDVSSFYTNIVASTAFMFSECSSLKTIYCNRDWSNSGIVYSDNMFQGCDMLVGGMGTKYKSSYRNKTYARPDGGTESPGYFTLRIKGDADGNGQVNAADIVAISNYMMGNPPAGFSKASADVNIDGVINIADIVAVSNILLNDSAN